MNWPTVKLGDVASIKHGWAFKSEFFSEEQTGNPILVNIGNFRYDGGFRFESTKVKEYTGDYPREYELSPGDILLVMTCQTAGGEILGIPGRIPNDGKTYLHNQRLGKVEITAPELVDADFLYWVFLTKDFNNELFRSATGTKILHTAPNRIENYSLRLPPLSVQTRIADVLWSIEDKVELNRRMNETLEQMAMELYRNWFVDFAPFQDSEFVDSERGMIPKGWSVVPLGSVIDINQRNISKTYQHDLIEYVDISSVEIGRLGETRVIPLQKASSRARRLVQDGDVIWSMVRPNRKSYLLIHEPAENLVVSTGFAVLTPRLIPTSYLYTLTTTEQFVDYLTNNAQGSAYPAVRADDFENAKILLPPSEVLEAFDKKVDEMYRMVSSNEKEVRYLTETRNCLVPKLMSGNIDVLEITRPVKEVV